MAYAVEMMCIGTDFNEIQLVGLDQAQCPDCLLREVSVFALFGFW